MQMRIINIFTMALLGMLFFMAGCGKAESKMTIEEGVDWFQINKAELLELKELLLKHPNIEWIYPDLSIKEAENYAQFNAKDKVAYEFLQARCNFLKIHLVKSWRSLKNPESMEITFLIDSHGISISGCSLSVKYITSENILIYMRKRGDVIKSVNLADWYVIYSES